MPDHHDVLHVENVDGELQHREIVGVLGRRQVADVPMHEQLTGVDIHDLVGGHAAVRAADPEEFRRLLALEPAEVVGILRDHTLRPGTVVLFQMIDHGALRDSGDSAYGHRRSGLRSQARG